MQNKLYLSGLNGIRAIAAIGVLLSHINLALINFGIKGISLFGFDSSGRQASWSLGEHGVTMFFVLSGFLISYLLLKEKDKTDTVNKRKFYIRRILRIWPLYYLFIILSIIVYYLYSYQFPNFGTLAFYVFLLANIPFILQKTMAISGHLWSIAVEEQFYIFWPHCFKNINRLQKVLIIIIGLAILLRILLWVFYPHTFFTILFTVNRFDCMLFGGLIAILLYKNSPIIKFIDNKIIQLISWLIILFHFLNYEIVNSIVSLEIITLCIGIIIIGQVNIANRLVNLENKFLNFIGKYSFGIYVYHPLIIYVLYNSEWIKNIENELTRTILVFAIIILTTLVISYLSYEYFEKKFINIKSKYSVIHSTNNKTEGDYKKE